MCLFIVWLLEANAIAMSARKQENFFEAFKSHKPIDSERGYRRGGLLWPCVHMSVFWVQHMSNEEEEEKAEKNVVYTLYTSGYTKKRGRRRRNISEWTMLVFLLSFRFHSLMASLKVRRATDSCRASAATHKCEGRATTTTANNGCYCQRKQL